MTNLYELNKMLEKPSKETENLRIDTVMFISKAKEILNS